MFLESWQLTIKRDGFSNEILLRLNLHDTRNRLYRSNVADDLHLTLLH